MIGTIAPGLTSVLKSNGCGGAGAEVAFMFAITGPSSIVITTNFPETDFDTVKRTATLRMTISFESPRRRPLAPPPALPTTSFPRSGSNTSTAPDVVLLLDVPGQSLSLHIDSPQSGPGGFDNTISIKATECSGAKLGCADSGTINLSDVAPGQHYIFVDGYFAGEGDYTVNVSGVIASGETCDPAVSDIFACQAGHACNGGVCSTAACNDGTDADGEGHPGYPSDPGCESPSDNDETDSCPGAGCPQCSNGADDDGDMAIDYPNEIGCAPAGDNNEEDCPLVDVVELMATPLTGTTAGASNEITPICRSSNAPDVTHQLIIPGDLETLAIDTDGSSFDTIMSCRFASPTASAPTSSVTTTVAKPRVR